jgi:hypothetical protein
MDKLAKTNAQVAIERIKEGLYLDEFAKDKRATQNDRRHKMLATQPVSRLSRIRLCGIVGDI